MSSASGDRSSFKQKAGAETDVVKWRGERDVARAAVLRAKAKVEKAGLDLSYTKVTAPLSGRVSRNLVDLGNLVGESEPTLLTTVTRYDPMYVYFNLNERDLLKVMAMNRKKVQEKGLDPAENSEIEADIQVFLAIANEEGYPHQGKLDFAESRVDEATGTLQLRGVFPNPGPAPVLIPGLFVRLRMPVEKRENALLVTERAIGSDQNGRYLDFPRIPIVNDDGAGANQSQATVAAGLEIAKGHIGTLIDLQLELARSVEKVEVEWPLIEDYSDEIYEQVAGIARTKLAELGSISDKQERRNAEAGVKESTIASLGLDEDDEAAAKKQGPGVRDLDPRKLPIHSRRLSCSSALRLFRRDEERTGGASKDHLSDPFGLRGVRAHPRPLPGIEDPRKSFHALRGVDAAGGIVGDRDLLALVLSDLAQRSLPSIPAQRERPHPEEDRPDGQGGEQADEQRGTPPRSTWARSPRASSTPWP